MDAQLREWARRGVTVNGRKCALSASKKLRRDVTIRKRRERAAEQRARSREHSAEMAARREAARNAPPGESRATGILPASMALAAMALAGAAW